jgi:CBS domain-containing protein
MTTTSTPSRRTGPDLPVAQVMHPGVIGCAFETPITAVARLMAEHRIHCVVGLGDATEDDTSLWGLISDTDVVAALACGEEACTAGQVAAAAPVTVRPHDTVRHVAALMRDHGVSHVVVVGAQAERPLGIVSSLDLMRFLGGR